MTKRAKVWCICGFGPCDNEHDLDAHICRAAIKAAALPPLVAADVKHRPDRKRS